MSEDGATTKTSSRKTFLRRFAVAAFAAVPAAHALVSAPGAAARTTCNVCENYRTDEYYDCENGEMYYVIDYWDVGCDGEYCGSDRYDQGYSC